MWIVIKLDNIVNWCKTLKNEKSEEFYEYMRDQSCCRTFPKSQIETSLELCALWNVLWFLVIFKCRSDVSIFHKTCSTFMHNTIQYLRLYLI